MDLFDNRLYVGIVGSRRRDEQVDYRVVLDAFLRLLQFGCRETRAVQETLASNGGVMTLERVVIVSGGCLQGGDRFAELIAKGYGVATIIHRPDRTTFLDMPEPFRSAKQNYARNELVARDSRDALIACVASDRTGGTEDTIKRYRRLHKREPILV